MNETYKARIEKAKKEITDAEFILIGGGSGLSAAAGITYSGKRFTDNFSSFIKRYGLSDMYSSGFYPFETQEERWAYWAKHIYVNRFEPGPTKLYKDLYQLVKDKSYFVITTNVESQFEKSGFSANKIFEVQGNYGYLQCAKGCHDRIYYNESLVKEMIKKTVDCKIPFELVPKCPVCGRNMDPNLRINQYFVQDEKWYKQNKLYNEFLKQSEGKRTIYMEMGVGFNTPGIIRYPFEQMTFHNKGAILIRLNKENPKGMKGNEDKTVSFNEDIKEVVSEILK
ncbi:SIR2 family NAD-dependent protein deacylase [Priestia endophytica]|uniref:SIR2 family NAD-dependent protein deacylase n=1 Tax=Priestia endophytica TaxID=135735 RepID=UPI000DCA954D|nr:Sir2 silent information regulator family NAD-dependent deacetylase [Priestia endophytica]RAS74588.1 Sir2 silent information regulator family NAD-dependent deacetylase [Priestia endophytica]